MMEPTVPWWRRAIAFALNGIRSGFGLFRRNENPATAPEINTTPQAAAGSRPAETEESQVNPYSPPSELIAAEETPTQKIAPPAEAVVALSEPAAEIVEPAAEPVESAQEEPGPVPAAPSEKPPAPREEPAAPTTPRAGGATVVSPALQRGETGFSDLAAESRRDDAKIFVLQESIAPDKSLPIADSEIPSETEPTEEPAEATPAETTPAAETASPEEVSESIEIAAEAAPEATAPKVEPASVEEVNPQAAPTDEPDLRQAAEAAPEEATTAEPAEESVETPAPATESIPATESAAAPPAPESAPAPEPPSAPEPSPAPPQDIAPTLPFAEKPAARTAADKVAAALKAREARGEDAEQSPFSVVVNEVYDGPLDLLLDLIRRQDIDIYDIPIAKITAQFLAYVDRLRASDMDVAGEFIYTAALLIHIKSKMLLPRAPVGPEDAAEDPRRELVERLLEHERFRNAAQMLLEKQMLEAATWTNPGIREFQQDSAAEPEIAADTTDLVRVFTSILERARNRPIIDVQEDSVTVGQMIRFLARRLNMEDRPVALHRLLSHTSSERALIAMFLALLELVRLQAILLRQDRQFSEIFVKKHTGFEALMNQGLANARDDWR
jgi:segregation and condensation protein A